MQKVVYLRTRKSCKIDDSDVVITVEQETEHAINNPWK
jgi:hypothetical protein